VMRVEKGGQPVDRIARQGDWKDTRDWQPVHISLNGQRPNYVGGASKESVEASLSLTRYWAQRDPREN
jgi:hypothetical protein